MTTSYHTPAFIGQPTFAFNSLRTQCYNCDHRTRAKRARRRIFASASRDADPITSSPLGAPTIICFGEALFDLFSESPSASITDPSAWKALPGGAPANLAVGLAKLSTGSAFVGSVGDDSEGDKLRQVLANAGVNVDGLQTISGRPTRRVFVRRNKAGDRAFVGFSDKNESFADANGLDLETLPGVLFYAAQVLVTPTLSLAFPGSAAALKELVELARICKLRIVVDVNWRDVFWRARFTNEEARSTILGFLRDSPGADLVKLSQDEVAFLFDDSLAGNALDEPDAVLRNIGGKCSGVIITAGAEGASYAFEDGMELVVGRVPAVMPKGGAVDTTGAGDAFLAGFLSEMMRLGGPIALTDKRKAKQIAKFAVTVSSFVVASPGGIDPLPNREQVQAIMENKVA